MTQQDKHRAAFEAWANEKGEYDLLRLENGEYAADITGETYIGWQAATAHDRQQRGEPLTHRCKNCNTVFQGGGCPYCHLASPSVKESLTVAEEVNEVGDDIDIEDVRQYLEAWGCLAHPGVVALIARYGSKS